MTRRNQFGFSVVEVVIIVVVLAVIVAGGVMLAKRSGGSDPKVEETSTSVPDAPEVKSTSDLTKAQQALDEADVDAASDDASQFEAQLNGF